MWFETGEEKKSLFDLAVDGDEKKSSDFAAGEGEEKKSVDLLAAGDPNPLFPGGGGTAGMNVLLGEGLVG